MLRNLLIFLLALIIALGSTVFMYKSEVDGMIAMGQEKLDEIINGEKPDNPDEPSDDDDLKVESIALDTTGAKLVFDFGEEFTSEGLKVIATYVDGSTKEIAIGDCKLVKPDTSKPGERQVTVVYEGASARYTVTINLKQIPAISSTPLVDIVGENDSVPYRVEAELIDMVTPGAVKAEGVDSFIAEAPADADITGGDQYLTGYGVAWNYFGFTFKAAETFENTTLVLRVANPTDKDIDAGIVKMYLNFSQDENGVASGEIPLTGYIIPANGACKWADIVIRNVTIPEGTNTLTFETQKDNAFDIDYVDFYVGMRYINSVVEITDTTTIVKDLENFDTEKAFTRSDVAAAHNLKDGQLFVENVANESPGKSTNGGSSVGAIGKGSQMSTTIRLAQDATVLIKFKASAVGKGAYYVSDHWNFYIDGVKLTTVEYLNIEGGNASESQWWDWIYTNVGAINLSAGDHFFLLEVHGTDCNVDTVEFEIVSLGSFDESGTDLEDMEQPVEPPVEDETSIVINGKGEYVVEAEDLDLSNLTPSDGQTEAGTETPSGDGPATSGGMSVGKAGGGDLTFTFTLSDKATIQIYGVLAYAYGGDAASFMSAKLGETDLALSGTLPEGTGKMPYWNWAEIPFGGQLELEAGTYTVTATFLKNPNVDCFKIDVLSYGDNSQSADDAQISKDDASVTIEAETFDNIGVISREDFVNAGRMEDGEYYTEEGNGATCICGYLTGTWFPIKLTASEAMKVEVILVGATDTQYDVSTNLSLTVNGTAATISSGSLTGSGSTPYWDWKTVSLCTIDLAEGTNELILTIVSGQPNLDKIIFVPVDNETPVEHECESICTECGKCLDAECGETACAEKCEGHTVTITPDVVVEANGSAKMEAENVDQSGLVKRPDFPAEKGMTESWNNDFGSGTCLMGFVGGSKLSFVVEIKAAGTYAISLRMSHYENAVYDFSNITYTFAGQTLTPVAQGEFGHREATDYWKWVEVSLGELELEAGVYTFEMNMVSGGNHNIDYFQIATVIPAHECESVCTECGKCTDNECTETACAEKCEGHQATVTPDITITDASNSYKAEAENLSLENLVPQEGFETPKVESFTGGAGLGGIAGGYQTFVVKAEKDVTVALKIAFAKYEGGSILSFVSGVSVNGEALTLTDGQIAPGTTENKWWNVSNVQVATIDLVAGQIYTFQVSVNSGNLDGYVLEVVENIPEHECESVCTECGKCLDAECGETACAEKCEGHTSVEITPDVVVNGDGTYKIEAEDLSFDNLVLRSDFAAAGRGFTEAWSNDFGSGTCLCGFIGGSKLSYVVKVEETTTLTLSMLMSYYSGESYDFSGVTYSFAGQTLTPTPAGTFGHRYEGDWWKWVEVSFGEITVEAGTYTFEMNYASGDNHNIDHFAIVASAPVSTHECESICTACGKCTDSECAEAACESKCAGHTIDAAISTDDVAVTLEGESWNYADDSIVTRSDFVPSIGEGNLKSEAGNGATCIFAFAAGTKFVLNIDAASDMTVDLLLRGATDAAGYDASKLAVTLNGKAVSGSYGSLTGVANPTYWDWQLISLGRLDLVEGVNEITITVLEGHPNIDFVRLVPVKADITVAASGSTVLHMENFDEHKSVIDSKDDFVNAYKSQGFAEGDVFKNPGLGRIYGFNASTFVMHIEVTEACTLNISVNLWNCNALNTYKYYFGGQAINCTNETAPTAAGNYEIGSVTLSEAGIYTFIFTTGGVDFDEVIFTVE